MRVTCPVDGTDNDDRERCRQCSADLRPLLRVLDLPARLHRDGVRHVLEGRAREGREALAAAVALEPDAVDARLALARAYAGDGSEDAAAAHLERARALAPDSADVAAATADVGRFVEARRAARAPAAAAARRPRALWWGVPAAFLLGVAVMWLIRPVAPAVQEPVASRVSEAARVPVPGAPAPEPVAVPQVPPVVYTVRPGDSLWAIASRKYGNPGLWQHILAANGRLSDPARLTVGQQLTLPPITLEPR